MLCTVRSKEAKKKNITKESHGFHNSSTWITVLRYWSRCFDRVIPVWPCRFTEYSQSHSTIAWWRPAAPSLNVAITRLHKVDKPTYHVNVIKLKWKIIWTGGLPHLSGLPHLPGVPPPPCKQALSDYRETTDKRSSVIHNNYDEHHKVYTLAVEFRFLSFNLFNYFSY